MNGDRLDTLTDAEAEPVKKPKRKRFVPANQITLYWPIRRREEREVTLYRPIRRREEREVTLYRPIRH